jgi:hypothetical protein
MDPEEQQAQETQSAQTSSNESASTAPPQASTGAESAEPSEAASAASADAVNGYALNAVQTSTDAASNDDGGGSFLDKVKSFFGGGGGDGNNDDVASMMVDKAGPAASGDKDDNADLKKALADVRDKMDNDPAVIAQKLKDKFQIVPEDYDGPRSPNTLTQKEFDQMAELDSRIRNGKTDIQFDNNVKTPTNADPDAHVTMNDKQMKNFKNDAMGDMETMMQTNAGRELLSHLANNTVTDKDGNVVHHTTTIGLGANPDQANCKPINDPDEVNAANGVGDNSRITYTPGVSRDLYSDGKFMLTEHSDQTLLHEMNHAYHYGQGDTATGAVNPVNPADTGIDKAEYQAVGLDRPLIGPPTPDQARTPFTENLYRAEQRQLGIDAPNRDFYNMTSKK